MMLTACGGPVAGDPDAGPGDAGPPQPDAWMEPPLVEERACPGSAGCESLGDEVLWAGAAAIEITPEGFETFTDTNGDSIWNAGEEAFDDANGNGVFDAAWIAGFGNARAAQGVMNPQWARALVLRVGDVTIALVALDVVGWFLDEVTLIREAVDAEALGVDYVAVGATHVHQARDTIGIWGPSLSETGVSEAYQALVRERAVQAVREAVGDLREANVQYASVFLRDVDTPSDVNRYVGDNRDPNILDDELRMLRFIEAGTATAEPGTGTTIATLVNFASHPEYQGSRNPQLSSDWPHWMREAIEGGIDVGPEGTRVEGVGGTVVYFNGALGSQIGPNGLHVRQWDGTPVLDEDSDESAITVGTQLGHIALEALRGAGTTTEDTAAIGFRYRQFFVTVENRRYHIAGTQGVFVRALYNYDETRLIRDPSNLPDVLTEVAVIDVGAATMLTAPGELDPAEFVGGYEAPCPYTPGGCDALIDEDDENPPDVTRAPTGPFLRDHLLARRADAQQVWLLGLTNDFLGYFVPDFDYELGEGLPYITEAPGDHYEETNSIGTHGWPRIRQRMIDLIEWVPSET
ncbi:MAG: hypothetical protein M3Y87_15060 [Myxococcota bacterium]|nr:hypothetical protein [Myxococcota bacterium]